MPRNASDTPCLVGGCIERGSSRGMCKLHYDRWRRERLPRCSVDDCENPATLSTGICQPCTKRRERTGTLDRRSKATRINRKGYTAIWLPDHPTATAQGWALEHRVVAYDAGLLTGLGDLVHHINHDKRDNRLENLEVLTPTEHAELHGEEREIIDVPEARRLYEDELWSVTDLANRYGVNSGTVSRTFERHGVAMRTPGETRALRNRVKRERPGWFVSQKTKDVHFGPDGANDEWLTACGLIMKRPGTVDSDRVLDRCERCIRVLDRFVHDHPEWSYANGFLGRAS